MIDCWAIRQASAGRKTGRINTGRRQVREEQTEGSYEGVKT